MGDEESFLFECPEERKNRTLQYALTHGIAHLVAAGNMDDSKKLLLDVKYLLARGDDGVRLMEDCKRLQGDRTMEVLSSALGLSLSNMRNDPRRSYNGLQILHIKGDNTVQIWDVDTGECVKTLEGH